MTEEVCLLQPSHAEEQPRQFKTTTKERSVYAAAKALHQGRVALPSLQPKGRVPMPQWSRTLSL